MIHNLAAKIHTHRLMLAFLGITATVLAFVLLAPGAASSAPQHRSGKSLPACRFEDGSGQRGACWWNGGRNGKGDRYVIENGRQTVVINSLRSCRALANVGTWVTYGEDGRMVWNGAELAQMMIDDARTFQWGSKGLDRACTAWLDEFARDHLKSLDKR